MKTPDYLITYAKTPRYLTTGKRYPINEDLEDGLYCIRDDEYEEIIVLVPGCAHIDDAIWKKGYVYYV